MALVIFASWLDYFVVATLVALLAERLKSLLRFGKSDFTKEPYK